MRKNEEEQGRALLQYGKAILMGGAVALAAGLAFLLLASAAISGGLLGPELRYQLAVAGCVVGSFVGGYFAVRQCNGRGLLVGIGVGAVLFLLQLTAGLLMYDSISPENSGLGLLLGDLCGGAAAGILGGGGKKSAVRKKKKKSK